MAKHKDTPFKVFLGHIKGTKERIYLEGFKWDCGWYWGGGYIGNNRMHCHFDGCFLERPDTRGHPLGSFYDPWTKLPEYLEEKDVQRINNGCSVWEPLSFFLDDARYDDNQWWRIKDLYKQFYALRKAAEVLQQGGHCTSAGRNQQEIQPGMAARINEHIEAVIIPEIVKALGVEVGK